MYVPNVLKSGSLYLLEPSGPIQACNGIALLSPRHYLGNLPHIPVIMIFIYSYQITDKITPVLAMKAYDGVQLRLHPFLT